MKAVPAWVYYSVLRVLMFAVPLAVFLLLAIDPWLSTVLAAIVGFCLSYIFLRKSRDTVASDIYRRRHRETEPVSADEEAEDAAVETAETTSAPERPEAATSSEGESSR
ncbi:DUF4229 domain-containing protein [Leifsonia sp. A12D58]|uniref:DUF4229 domain-containing protein n=1 Tax=Leifsonia sp. A12D58 TaxID=3397674 RepID=UPI0039E038B4